MIDFSDIRKRIMDAVGLVYKEVIFDDPQLITPTTTAETINRTVGYKWVLSFVIRVRSMGTATYIRIGTQTNQGYTLNIVGQTLEWSGNRGEVMDLTKLWVISDTSDAVLELIVSYLPLYMVGGVSAAPPIT